MNLEQLTDISYLTDTAPTGDFLLGWAFILLCIVCLFAPSLFEMVTKLIPTPKGLTAETNKKYIKKSLKGRMLRFTILGVIGIFLVLSRMGEVPFVSMRLLLGLWFLALVGTSSWTKWTIWRDYRRRVKSLQREMAKRP